ncbi:MAG: DUF1993 family protein [Burkholderiaceae bacterium]
MAISMYHASVPQFKKMLVNLSAILIKAETHSSNKKIDQKVVLGSRLFLDMFALTKQVQITCDQAKNGLARLACVDIPKFEDNEATFTELQERISKTIHFLDALKPEQMEGSADKEIKFSIGEWKFEFIGDQYLLTWIIPNFYFHITTAYNILRHNGVDVGKTDFLGV